MSVIKVSNLSKSYLISHQLNERYTVLRDVIANKFKALGERLMAKGKDRNPSPLATLLQTEQDKDNLLVL
jgi:lipopolysaccharide transport system ATP-binding protein